MEPFWSERFGNPASLHSHGLKVRDAMAAARAQIAALINAPSSEEIIFTSDGTESMNLAIKGVAWANESRGRHIVISTIEHPGIEQAVRFLEHHGFACTRVPVDNEGMIRPSDFAEAITNETLLVATHHVNHDLGTIQPVAEIGALVAEHGIPFYVDAEASAGWCKIDLLQMHASLLSLSPQRFGGPKGVGALYRSRRVPLTPLIHGGNQEGGLRAGIENVAGIVGAGIAAEIAGRELVATQGHVGRLQAHLWKGIQEKIPHVRLNGPPPGPNRAPNALNISIEFLEGEGIALACDLKGLAIASGSACQGKSLKIPPALAAIGLSPELARANVILSMARQTTEQEITDAMEILAKTVERLRDMSDS